MDGFLGAWMDGWMSEVLNFCSVENTLLTYANGIPSSACKTPEMTLPKCDTEFLFPTCIRESWSQKVRGEDWHFAAGNLQVRTQCLKLQGEAARVEKGAEQCSLNQPGPWDRA